MPPVEPTPTDANPDYPGGTPPTGEPGLPGVSVEPQTIEPQPDASLDYGGAVGEPAATSDPLEALAPLPPMGDELSGSADYEVTTTSVPQETTTTTTGEPLPTTTTIPAEPTTTSLPKAPASASPSQPPFSMPTE